MKDKIGKIAGKIWEILRTKEEVEISRFPRMLNEKSDVTYQAIGWLAREDKIHYAKKANKIYIYLTESERGIPLE